ncbi:MAG TPA: long-chain fatty acid--CoA ligase [Puia sp.]|nr:long-chain fatty acid--CoA ligase [Puia sp.]
MLYGQMMNFPLSIQSIIEYGNKVFPYKEIVSKMPDGSWHRYSYAAMYERTKKLASALVKVLDIQPGDRVATFAWNHYQHLELYYAIPGVGAVCHPLNIRLSSDQIEFIANHAEDKVVFLDASLIPIFEPIIPKLKTIKHIVLINAPADLQHSLPNVIEYEELIKMGSIDFNWATVDENQASGMCYTSGTTGNPKGVLYSHRSTYLHALTTIIPNISNVSSRDRFLSICPMFHAMAWGSPFASLLTGNDIIMPSRHLQPAALIEIIQKENVTVANGVPTIWMGIYDELKRNPPKEKLTLREYMVGGSAFPASYIKKFEMDFGINCFHAWGMTETSPVMTATRLQPVHDTYSYDEQIAIKAKQGFEIPGVEIRVVLEDGSIAPRDGKTVGEFEVRGHWVIASYFKMNIEQSHSADGWFRTGDVGTIDEFGYMEITDRSKDLIKSGGEWISSVALETSLMSHPDVKEAAVIAIPDEKWMECPLACIVYKEGKTTSAQEFDNFLLERFSKYQLPKKYVSVKEIPKTGVGKFDKKKIRKLYAEGGLV